MTAAIGSSAYAFLKRFKASTGLLRNPPARENKFKHSLSVLLCVKAPFSVRVEFVALSTFCNRLLIVWCVDCYKGIR